MNVGGAYSVSKIAIEAVSTLFAKENEHPNIRFNCINPGATRTAMRAKAYPDEDPKTLPTLKASCLRIYI